MFKIQNLFIFFLSKYFNQYLHFDIYEKQKNIENIVMEADLEYKNSVFNIFLVSRGMRSLIDFRWLWLT